MYSCLCESGCVSGSLIIMRFYGYSTQPPANLLLARIVVFPLMDSRNAYYHIVMSNYNSVPVCGLFKLQKMPCTCCWVQDKDPPPIPPPPTLICSVLTETLAMYAMLALMGADNSNYSETTIAAAVTVLVSSCGHTRCTSQGCPLLVLCNVNTLILASGCAAAVLSVLISLRAGCDCYF